MTASERIREARTARPSIICSVCGEPLPESTIAYIWAHDDFAEHGDHYAAWDSTQANFDAARAITAAAKARV